jgi:hypothetical protein
MSCFVQAIADSERVDSIWKSSLLKQDNGLVLLQTKWFHGYGIAQKKIFISGI